MSSLVERLRNRSNRRPLYNLDESDDEAYFVQEPKGQDKLERIVRTDAKDDSCQSCGESGDLIKCETCTYAYHSKCLLRRVRRPPPESWRCPECVSPLNEIEKILDCKMQPTIDDESDASKPGSEQIFVKQYLVKWKDLSHLHCTWVHENAFLKAYKTNPHLRTKVKNFDREAQSNSEDDAIRPEWTTVDRILASRDNGDEREFFVKWKDLDYDKCQWEVESDIAGFQSKIENFERINSPSRNASSRKCRSSTRDAKVSREKQQEFQQFNHTPEFLFGGSLHSYQLEGLNFLRFSWSKHTHVILADEMGLGKTIQSIAFIASLCEENHFPHLVVGPLSTLRNWEREFAIWAPQLNVVMYHGNGAARKIIRDYEFYFPKGQLKNKKKMKTGEAENKQDNLKLDVLLTSYDTVNSDSTYLKPIKWECVIVDEGHRLKNKDSKLFHSLKLLTSNHRVLLTGTPLQNNLDELFMLMHFLDARKFDSLEDFQKEFKDIIQEEQIARLHKMLAPHLLRRVKKDVLEGMPPKKELILRVELSSKQREYYKAILTRNYEILTRKGDAQVSLINVVMELRKLCCHAYMLDGVQPVIEDANEAYRQLLDASGKMHLLDKLMVKLKQQGHRVLIYSQFQHMLDLLEDYCSSKKWQYERIDGKVSGAERQIRIDRFNAENSSQFCFLLSTRAGGVGINLATADTVILYDSDWNPHADLQAIARAHRLGQTNTVMIYRLITRGTIEERMMQLTKKKMVLEHLVVGRLESQNLNQVELDDILRYGSKELFSDEGDEAGKSRHIHYDDDAIDRILDRDQAGNEKATVDDGEGNGFFDAFKVANFGYMDEEEAQKASVANQDKTSNSNTKIYWEELLKDKNDAHTMEESTALGKGKRKRTQMLYVERDDLFGLEDLSPGGEDDDSEAETVSSGTTSGRKPHSKKRAGGESNVPLPLMEGEGKSLKVLGFNQRQRATFVQTLMSFGVGDYDWHEFIPHLKQKSFAEISEYGTLFLTHIAEDITESPTFSDGVPKEGLQIQDVLARIGQLLSIKEKVEISQGEPDTPLFSEEIVSRYPQLKDGRSWKEEHDILLLNAVLKHGYGNWRDILEDKDLNIQQIICQEQYGACENISSSDSARMNQKKMVEFIKKRVNLLEKGLAAELQKFNADNEQSETASREPGI